MKNLSLWMNYFHSKDMGFIFHRTDLIKLGIRAGDSPYSETEIIRSMSECWKRIDAMEMAYDSEVQEGILFSEHSRSGWQNQSTEKP